MKNITVLIVIICCSAKLVLAQNTSREVAYGDEPQQKMDIYLPAKAKGKTPAIVLIHGGGWIGGDKSNMNYWLRPLQDAFPDYAIFNINYRLGNQQNDSNQWPTQIDDVEKAVDFIRSKAADYHLKDHEMVLIGESAGAQLALVEGYGHNPDNMVKVVVDLFGPADMVNLYDAHHELALLMKGTPQSEPQVYQDASAINLVSKKTPATIIFHGTADPLVPIKESDSLNVVLQKAKVPVKYITYPGKGHGWKGADQEDTYSKAISFIKAHI